MIPKWSLDVCGLCGCRSYASTGTGTSTAQIGRRHLLQVCNTAYKQSKNSLTPLLKQRDWGDWGQEIKQQLAMNSRRRGDRDRGREINSRGLEAGRARRASGEQGRGNPLESRGCARRRRAGSRGGRKLRRGSSPVAAGGGRKSRRAHACCGAMRRGRRGKPRQGQQGYGGLLLGWAVFASPDTSCPQIRYVPAHVSEFRENNKNQILPRYVSVAYLSRIRIRYVSDTRYAPSVKYPCNVGGKLPPLL
jgi:hypothetical protein